MILGVDIDNVLADYTDGLRNHMITKFNTPTHLVEEYYPEPIDYVFSNWKYLDGTPHPTMGEVIFKENHSEAVANGLFKTLNLLDPKASEILWKLDSEGHRIRIITARFVTHGQNYKAVSHTAEWLDKQDIPYRDLLFMSDKEHVEADLFIDDSPHNLVNLLTANKQAIVYNKLYNNHVEHHLKANNWTEVYEIIHQLDI